MIKPVAYISDYDLCMTACLDSGMSFDQAWDFVNWNGTDKILGKESSGTGQIQGLEKAFENEKREKILNNTK